MRKNYLLLIIFMVFIPQSGLLAQDFEYAMTEKDLAGAKISDLLLVKDRIYVAGRTKDEGNPLIIVFDTLGNLLDYQTFLPEVDELYYGYISHILYDESTGNLTAISAISPACDVGGPSIFKWTITTELEKMDEFKYPIPGMDGLSDPSANLDDSLIAISVQSKTFIYNLQDELQQEISLPEALSNPQVIMHEDQLITFDRYHNDSLFLITQDGSINLKKKITHFSRIELVDNKLISAGSDGKIRVLDPASLEILDSLENDNYSTVEFSQLGQGLLEIIFSDIGKQTSIEIYDLDLNFIRSIPSFTNYESNFISQLDEYQNLYQMSSYYNINFPDATSSGLIPVFRKFPSTGMPSILRPSLEITDVQVINPGEINDCLYDSLSGICTYSFPSANDLKYQLTIKNTGETDIINIGHYVGTVNPSFCGYLYQDYRYYENLNIPPGESMSITDTVQMGLVADAKALNFYLAGPNHVLATGQDSTFYTVDNISTSTFAKNGPELLRIYPNPVYDKLNISNPSINNPSTAIEIISMTGQIIKNIKISDTQIDLRGLNPGMYYLRIQDGKKQYLNSFIKME